MIFRRSAPLDIDPGGRAGVGPLSKRSPPLQGDRTLLPLACIGDLNRVRVADRHPMTTSVEEAVLPPFNNQSGACSRCAARGPIRVHFDRDCARARGDHFHSSLPVWGTSGSSDRAVHLVVDAAARILAHPRVSVGCPYTSPIRGHRVRQRPAGSPRFLTHAMGCDGVGNALNVNRTLEVGGSTPLGSTHDSAPLPARWLSIFAVSSRGVCAEVSPLTRSRAARVWAFSGRL